MISTRSSWLRGITAAALAFALPAVALAQAYPDKPIRIVVPFSPGGGLDVAARTLGKGLSDRMGQPVIVENKPGANGIIATTHVVQSKPDGYTLYLTVTSPWSMLPALYQRPLGYDAAKDYTAIALLAEFQTVIITNPKTQVSTLQELIARAKASPGKLSYSSTGSAQPYTLATELFKSKVGIDILQVPYPGAAPAVQAVAAGDVDVAMFDMGPAGPLIKAGRLKPLAVMSKSRLATLPDVPTLAEAGVPGVDVPTIWMGFVGPANLPPAIVSKLNLEINQVMRSPEMKALFEAQQLTPLHSTPEQMDAQIKSDTQTWGALIRRLNIRLE